MPREKKREPVNSRWSNRTYQVSRTELKSGRSTEILADVKQSQINETTTTKGEKKRDREKLFKNQGSAFFWILLEAQNHCEINLRRATRVHTTGEPEHWKGARKAISTHKGTWRGQILGF